MNGQKERQYAVSELLTSLPFDAVVETGTYLGSTTKFFREVSELPVYTVEAKARFFFYSRRRLRHEPNVRVFEADSRDFIQQLAEDEGLSSALIFFYLDAHWYDDLPLGKELELINSHWKEWVVMIDDFEVPDDSGYQYDTYANGTSLTLEYVPQVIRDASEVFWPTASSADETGMKRGSVVLGTRGAVAGKISQLESLRPWSKE